MADATQQILGLGTGLVPLDYNVTGDTDLDLVAVQADFDGSGSAVAFVPMVQIIGPAGQVMAQAQGDSIAAGASGTATFFPFGKKSSGGSTEDTKQQDMTWGTPFVTPLNSDPATFSLGGGQPIFFDVVAGVPTCVTAGNYLLTWTYEGTGGAFAANSYFIINIVTNASIGFQYNNNINVAITASVSFPAGIASVGETFVVGDTIAASAFNGDPGTSHQFGGSLVVLTL